MTSRGLDHVVHAVRDLDAAAAVYRRLGFTVGARNRHSWGTHNQLIQLPGFFVELLTVAEPERLGTDAFSALFGTFNRVFLKDQEGLSLIILESRNAEADAAAFRAAGIGISDAWSFEREGRRPDGSTVKVGFSLAFARDPKAHSVGFAICQQHYPENFWDSVFQQHGNGASEVAGAVLVADSPSDHQGFLSAFTGVPDLAVTLNGISASTPRGTIEVVTAPAFRDRFGVDTLEVSMGGARLAAVRFRVRDPERLVKTLDRGDVAHSVCREATVVAPQTAMGATLVFE